ncbi:hypothetical protein GCM10011574_61110 [Microbispora bryophytorum]|uniref:Uncharacterized protein n=1 Tax=Microbispora bryophytorum TaxID=1460882 RepID=A0A8H9H4W6_9ACTN|nr:hypothetical protein GCM10011574_61110 [Microbispora bryophytorum]
MAYGMAKALPEGLPEGPSFRRFPVRIDPPNADLGDLGAGPLHVLSVSAGRGEGL